jgi:hypothetical protein
VSDTPSEHPGRADSETGEDSERAEDSETAEAATPGRREHGSEEEIDEASDESFPASDAPQWWSGEPGDDA